MKKVLVFSFLIATCLFADLVWAVEKIDINSASLAQLDEFTGIGPVYAQRIIDGRPYSSIDDLDRVKGIGPATLQKIKDQGLACVNCGTTNPNTQSPISSQTPPAESPTANNAESGTPPAPIVYPSGVYINEILPNPSGSDELEEWIVPTIQLIPLAYL